MRKYVLILAIAMPLAAAAQFFDHFEGNELAGHWQFSSEGSQWEYNVSNSVLNVTRLYGPFNYNEVDIHAWFSPQADFDMTVVMGWDAGLDQVMYSGVSYEHPFASWIDLGGFGYVAQPGSSPYISFWFAGGGSTTIDVPPPGMYEFRLRRIGDVASGYFNGELVFEASGISTVPARLAILGFASSDMANYGGLHVDRVGVVPEPGTMSGLLAALVWVTCRRRRRNGG